VLLPCPFVLTPTLILHYLKSHSVQLTLILPRAAKCRAHHCDRVTDDGIFALTSHAHHLHELDISYCSEVTSHGISTLARCPSLEVLWVPGTSASEDFCLELCGLSSLHLKGLSSVGDTTITGTLSAGSSMRSPPSSHGVVID